MATKKKQRKPLVFASQKATEVQKHYADNPEKHRHNVEPPLGGWDSAYVPGFSDLKHINAQRAARGQELLDIPIECAWARATGEGDYRGMMEWRRKGYELVSDGDVDDDGKKRSKLLEQYGFEVPPASQIMPDGTIRRDDLVLVYCSGERRRQNEAETQERTRFLEGSSSQENIEMETEVREKISLDDTGVSFE